MRYEILENNAVVNTIAADASVIQALFPDGNYRLLPELILDSPPVLRSITVGEFYDRFGDLKYPILGSTNPMVQALIKDTSVRQFIDLDNPQLPSGLQLLVDAGFAIDIASVLA